MTTMTLPHWLDRSLTIQATPETVFRFFQDSARWAKWWGAGSTIDPKPGGAIYIRHPDGTESKGNVIEVVPPNRLLFTYGFVSGKPFAPGESRVTIALEPHQKATRLTLTHEFPDGASRDEHVQGWRFQLSLFANVVANEVNANASRYVDLWFQAWSEPDDVARKKTIAEIATPEVRMHDQYSSLDGMDDLLPHLAAAQRFMPGITLKRSGDVRHCQGMVLSDWTMSGLDGKERGKGTNVFVFSPTGRIEWVTGFWG